jgi:hypothetical protein
MANTVTPVNATVSALSGLSAQSDKVKFTRKGLDFGPEVTPRTRGSELGADTASISGEAKALSGQVTNKVAGTSSTGTYNRTVNSNTKPENNTPQSAASKGLDSASMIAGSQASSDQATVEIQNKLINASGERSVAKIKQDMDKAGATKPEPSSFYSELGQAKNKAAQAQGAASYSRMTGTNRQAQSIANLFA